MKSFAILLSLVTLSFGSFNDVVDIDQLANEGGQMHFQNKYPTYPGIDIDLGAKCLVQLEHGKPPLWMTELEKVRVYSPQGILADTYCGLADSRQGQGNQLLRHVRV